MSGQPWPVPSTDIRPTLFNLYFKWGPASHFLRTPKIKTENLLRLCHSGSLHYSKIGLISVSQNYRNYSLSKVPLKQNIIYKSFNVILNVDPLDRLLRAK